MTFSRYGMMCKCWALDPCSRPSFSKLVSFVCDQLTDREEKVGLSSNMLFLKESLIFFTSTVVQMYKYYIWSTCIIISFLFQLYHNMLDQTSSDYQNAILDISALTKQKENQAQSANDYCRTHGTEESKAEVPNSDTVTPEETLVKPSDAEWSPVTECKATKCSKHFIYIYIFLKQFNFFY